MVLRVPLHHLGHIILMGDGTLTTPLLHRCGQTGIAVSFLDHTGDFQGRLAGGDSGNVVLRREQYAVNSTEKQRCQIARSIIQAKLSNSRAALRRSARDASQDDDKQTLAQAADKIGRLEQPLRGATTLEQIRGVEGQVGRLYISAFPARIKRHRETFGVDHRSRRPPKDPLNALLSYLYTVLASDCSGAVEGVGLDAEVGFLHKLRSGRPSLGLDLMEAFRPVFADRVVLAIINRGQITPEDFTTRPGGAVEMNKEARDTLLEEYQQQKRREATHPVLEQSTPLGLFPHLQARLLARTIRGEIEKYPAYKHPF